MQADPNNFFSKCFIACMLFLIAGTSFGQHSLAFKNLNVTTDTLTLRVKVNFETEKETQNLILLLIDNDGNNLFMESRHQFIGAYSHTIDLSKYPKGQFVLTLISDNEKIKKNLIIK